MTGRWADTRPNDAAAWLVGVESPWWFAGGWAIDLWLGRETRAHSDLEIGCFRLDLPKILRPFSDWEICEARQKQLRQYDLDAQPPSPPFSVWMRPREASLWTLEVVVEEHAQGVWFYRRDRNVTLPVANLTTITAAGLRVIVPEVQLLYKAKQLRDRDNADFSNVLPRLTSAARAWLRSALAVAHPDHIWITQL